MRPPSVLPILEGFGGTGGFEQNFAQPRCIAPLKTKGLAEYPGLMPTSRMRGVQTIVLDLARIEDCLIAVWQTRRHRGRLASYQMERKPIGIVPQRRTADTWMSMRTFGQGIIAPRRSNSAHLHRPWRASYAKARCGDLE